MAGSERTIKKRVFEIISKAEDGDRASEIFDWSIMILIALSIISIIRNPSRAYMISRITARSASGNTRTSILFRRS